jgi:PAS domain S-box-containing protein
MKPEKEEFELVLENIAAAVILFNEDGSMRYCNSYVRVLTGYDPDETGINSPEDIIEKVIVEEDRERYLRARRVCSLGEDSLVRFRVTHKSGLQLWLETRMVPVYQSGNGNISVMSISIDVTDTLQYQRQIEEQNQDLNDFAYMVSHDLKAPIFTIQGMTDALREDFGTALGTEGLALLEYISRAAQRLTILVSSVLEYSALTNTDETIEEVPLDEIVPNVISDFSEQLKGIDSDIKILNELPVIKGESVRMYQLFSNLVGNAIKYRSPDIPLKIEVSLKALSPATASIMIKDNGLGIPENKQEDIFRPYRRAHGSEIEGTGIGLACVKKIVEKSGGQISLESTVGKGSSFTVTLPLAKPGKRKIPQDLERIYPT